MFSYKHRKNIDDYRYDEFILNNDLFDIIKYMKKRLVETNTE
jgi:hypothetical protein